MTTEEKVVKLARIIEEIAEDIERRFGIPLPELKEDLREIQASIA